MQLVDSKLYVTNLTALGAQRRRLASRGTDLRFGGAHGDASAALLSWLKATSASARLLAMMLAAFVVAASPALLGTIRSALTLALQILLEVGHFGFIAFQIFGR